jgi:CHASE2 domain-containing sensor protein
MFDVRPADNKPISSRSFEVASQVASAGQITISAARRVVKGVQALICLYLCFIFAVGVLGAIATARSQAQVLVVLALGGVIVGGFGYAAARMISGVFKNKAAS